LQKALGNKPLSSFFMATYTSSLEALTPRCAYLSWSLPKGWLFER